MSIIISFLITCLTMVVSTKLLPGIHVDNWTTIVLVSLVFSVINVVLKPILVIISLPLTILTLGLFLLVVNAALIMLTATIVPGFSVDGWLTAIMLGVIISVVNSILQRLFR